MNQKSIGSYKEGEGRGGILQAESQKLKAKS